MTKKEWKKRYYALENKYSDLNSKYNVLKYINEQTIKDLTNSILESSDIIETIEAEESNKVAQFITKYSSLKQQYDDEVINNIKIQKELENQINFIQTLYDDLVSSF